VFVPRPKWTKESSFVRVAAPMLLILWALCSFSKPLAAQERGAFVAFDAPPAIDVSRQLIDSSTDHPDTHLPWLTKSPFDFRTISKMRLDVDPDFDASSSTPQFDAPDHRGIEWGGLLVDSTKFLLFQHAFRLATEVDTRRGLHGPFLQNYADSLTNIHGWNDGDPFFVNYIDHPMEGGVAGFIEIAHDPRYRRVEFSRSPQYWKSRLRATAFSAVFSMQFEIGPVSEASIGGIQRVRTKTGVVDWVITPTVGFGWMIGEDALDKYVIERFEVRTQNSQPDAQFRKHDGR
jgi:hypothetical protein